MDTFDEKETFSRCTGDEDRKNKISFMMHQTTKIILDRIEIVILYKILTLGLWLGLY